MSTARYNKISSVAPEEPVRVTRLSTAHIYFLSPTYSYAPERHSAWEIVYLHSGKLLVDTAATTYELQRGQMLLIPPYEGHGMRSGNVMSHIYICSFECECERLISISDRVLDADGEQVRLMADIVAEGLIYLAGINNIPALPDGQTAEYASGQVLKNRIELLLISLIRKSESHSAHAPEGNREARSDTALVTAIKDFLRANVCKKITLADVSAGLGYSVPHLCSVFKKNTGHTIMQYFIQQRIAKAKELIFDGKMTLSQISDYMGFDSPQYFSFAFKKYTDLTPSQYASIACSKTYTLTDNALQIL